MPTGNPPPADQSDTEREFLAASVAVWREIDRLSALPGGYRGLSGSTELRQRERKAWGRYRETLDRDSAPHWLRRSLAAARGSDRRPPGAIGVGPDPAAFDQEQQ